MKRCIISLILIVTLVGCASPGRNLNTITHTPEAKPTDTLRAPTSTFTPAPTSTETLVPTATFTPVPTATPTPDLSLSPIVQESLTCANNYWCFDMIVQEEKGKEYYSLFLDALARSYVNRKYWQELGLTNRTGEGLLKFLKNSVGPDGSNYYLPLETEKGTRLQLIVPYTKKVYSNHYVRFKPIPVQTKDGITLDGLRAIVLSPASWSSNYNGIKDYISSLPIKLKESLLNYESIWGDRNEVGFNISADNRLILILGARKITKNEDEIYRTLGNSKDGSFRPQIDPNIATALALTYIHGLKDFQEIARRQSHIYKYEILYLCVTRQYDCKGVLVNDVEKEDIIFSPR